MPWAADVNTVAPEYIAKATALAWSGVEFRERQKASKLEELEEYFAFSVIGIEIFRPKQKDDKHLGKMIKERLKQTRAFKFLRQRISISLKCGNYKCGWCYF